MWASSSPGRNNKNRDSIYTNTNSLSKSYSSTCDSDQSAETPMEEVWRDITFTCLNDHPSGTVISGKPTKPILTLQDFLPKHKEHSRRGNVSMAVEETTLFGYLSHTPATTLLSLNSGCDFQYIGTNGCDPLRRSLAVNDRATVGSTHHNSAFNVFGSATVLPSLCQKRDQENSENSDDRKQKRMMKNRESAARSRARKQAYTDELELKVDRLQKENAKLRKQQDKDRNSSSGSQKEYSDQKFNSSVLSSTKEGRKEEGNNS